jgi:hypothetical protein
MKRLPFRQGGALALSLAVLAAVAIALWLGVFGRSLAGRRPDGHGVKHSGQRHDVGTREHHKVRRGCRYE